ncbi:MAG: hypothetical protein WAW52_04040 [Methanothrix sp.]
MRQPFRWGQDFSAMDRARAVIFRPLVIWDVLRPIKSIRLARTTLPGRGMLAKSCATV